VTFIGRGRRRMEAGSRGGTLAVTMTLAVHLVVGTAVVGTGDRDARVMPPVYRVNLVAAPRPEPQARRAPEAVQRPAEQPAPTARPA